MQAYLLTRGWRDQSDGIEVNLWATSASGPVNIVISGQRAVCFALRSETLSLPAGTERTPRQLKALDVKTSVGNDKSDKDKDKDKDKNNSASNGNADITDSANSDAADIDALYFPQQRHLNQLKQTLPESEKILFESDVKPHDRYLMERFIQSAFSINGEYQQHEHHRTYRNPRLSPASVHPELRIASLDIETRANTQHLYSIGVDVRDYTATSFTRHCGIVFMIDESLKNQEKNQESTNHDSTPVDGVIGRPGTKRPLGYQLVFVPDEKTLLVEFVAWLKIIDPDLFVGWAVVNFDLSFLQRAHQRLNVPFDYGRGRELSTILQPGSPGQPRVVRIPGRAVLDGIDLLKAGFWSFDSFSLDNVANQLLGTGKLIASDRDKVAEINRLFETDKPGLADYNFQDCSLVNDIFDKAGLVRFAIERANLTGLSIDRLGGSVAALDNLYLPRLHRRGFVARDVGFTDEGLGSPGGYVLDSQPGLYRNVLVLDFKSLYPSIIRTFKIDPLGMHQPGSSPIPGYLGAEFSRENHILPGLIEELWQARDEAKARSNAALSQAIKIIMNSFYGVLGSSGCRFHSAKLASSITRRGHDIITRSQSLIESLGYPVIYGDTDSLFVHLGDNHDAAASGLIGQQLMNELNEWWTKTLAEELQLTSRLEVEFETHYSRFFMPTVRGMPTGSKKRYAGLAQLGEKQQLVVKGLEAARTDWTPLARSFQRELFERVFRDEPVERYILDTASALNAGTLDDQLVYTKRLRRRVDEYLKNVPPHVQAARKLSRPGSRISYIVTLNGPEPVDQLTASADYEHYRERQLAPAADGILQFLGTSFADITDAQMSMF